MAKVAVTFRVMPESIEVDLAGIEERMRGTLGLRLKKLERKPVAFGLKSVEAIVVVEDASGEAEGVEEALRRIPGVGGVETTEVTLL